MRAEDTVLRRRAISRALKKALGRIPHKTVAKVAGISPSTLSTYITGQSLAGETKLLAIAEAIGMAPLDLWKAIDEAELEILAEGSADETREAPPPDWVVHGGDGLEASLRKLVRGIASEVAAELKAQGLVGPGDGGREKRRSTGPSSIVPP